MSDEPRGSTIDGTPWEEPRPPHLPDTLTRLSPWLIPFVLLAAVEIFNTSKQVLYPGAEPDLSRLLIIAADHLPGLVAALLGAALFWWHPDARRHLPLLVVGVTAVAVAELLLLVADPLNEVFLRLTPPDDESLSPYVLPLASAYRLFVVLLGAFGLVYIARGLTTARHRSDRVSLRGFAFALAAVSVVLAVIGALSVITAAPGYSPPADIMSDVLLGGSVLVNVAGLLTLSYVFVVTLGGSLAGERPRGGWLLAALGAGLLLGFRIVIAISQFMSLAPPGGGPIFFQLLLIASTLGWLLLLAAFVSGLPSTEAVPIELDPVPPVSPGLPVATPPGSGAG